MVGLSVPRLVSPVDTSGLANIGNAIGRYRQDAEIARIVGGLDARDPDSIQRVGSDLLKVPGGREMADRLLGLWNKRDVVTEDRKRADSEREGQIDAYKQTLPAMTRGIPDENTPAPPAPAPAPAPQGIVGGPIQPTSKVWGDDEAIKAGLYEPSKAAPAVAPAPLPPPPPRNVSGTGAAPSVAAPAAPPAVPPAVVTPPPSAAPVRMAGGPLGGVPAPLRAAQAPTAPVAPRFEDLVAAPAPEVALPAARKSDAQIQQDITELNARLGNPQAPPKLKEAISARVKQLEGELKHRRERDKDIYQARIKTKEGYDSRSIEHAFKANDKVVEQLQSDTTLAASLAEQRRILDGGIRTGQWANTGLWTERAKDFVGSMLEKLPGVDKGSIKWVQDARDTAGAMERFAGLGAKSLSDLLGGFGNRVSDTDAKRLDSVVATLDKTVTGNATLIKFADDLVQSRIAAAKEVQRYMQVKQSKNEVVSAADIASIQASFAKHAIDKMEFEANAKKAAQPAPAGAPQNPANVRAGTTVYDKQGKPHILQPDGSTIPKAAAPPPGGT